LTSKSEQELGPRTRAVFVNALKLLKGTDVPFLVGGAYAFQRHTGIARHTRDLDVFLSEEDFPTVRERFEQAGFRSEVPFPHWLGKVYKGRTYVDLIFSSGNGLARVDEGWFENALDAEVLGVPVRVCAVEEMIWSKGFIMERERFDGADVLHLLHERASTLDWHRLLARFAGHTQVLLSHLVLFAYVYPGARARIPEWVWTQLLGDLGRDDESRNGDRVCRGTLLSRSQYLVDLANGYHDARLQPLGGMSRDDLATWTEAAAQEDRTGVPGERVIEHARELRQEE
jgi:hypothetical protein